MSRKRRFLTFAAEIKHFQKQVGADTALAKRTVRAGEQGIGLILSVQALLFETVIPFAVKDYRAELFSGGILDAPQFR